jgi:cytochrome P450
MGLVEDLQSMGLGVTAIISVAAILATFILPTIVRSFLIWKTLRVIPSPPWDSFIFGHLPGFLSDKAPEIMAAYSERYGSVFRLRILWYWQVIVTDHKRVQQVLQKSATYVPKERRLYGLLEVATEPRMQNIVTASDGEYWKAVRQAWMKCLTSVNLKRVSVAQDLRSSCLCLCSR